MLFDIVLRISAHMKRPVMFSRISRLARDPVGNLYIADDPTAVSLALAGQNLARWTEYQLTEVSGNLGETKRSGYRDWHSTMR